MGNNGNKSQMAPQTKVMKQATLFQDKYLIIKEFVLGAFLILYVIVGAVSCVPDKAEPPSLEQQHSSDYYDSVTNFNCLEIKETDQETASVDILFEDVYLNSRNILSAMVELETSGPATACVRYGSDEQMNLTAPGINIDQDGKGEYGILGFVPQQEYFIQPYIIDNKGHVQWGGVHQITSGEWPEEWPLPELEINEFSSKFAEGGAVCYPQNEVYMCVNRRGEPVWYKANGGMSITRALSNGMFAVNYTSSISIYNMFGKRIKKLDLKWILDNTVLPFEKMHHDIIEITEGPWRGALAVITEVADTVNYPSSVTYADSDSNSFFNFPYTGTDTVPSEEIYTDGIIVIDWMNEKVLWEWSLHGTHGDNQTADPDNVTYTRMGLEGVRRTREGRMDLTHANSLLHGIDDGGQFFWLSLRNQDWIVKLDVTTEKIIWRLGYRGDFDLVDNIYADYPAPVSDEYWMYHMHAPEWQYHEDGIYKFILFDNGNVRPRNAQESYLGNEYSRVAEFVIDEKRMLAMPGFSFGSSDPEHENHFYSHAICDADMMPGSTSIIFVKGRGLNKYIAEISYPDGMVLWKLVTGNENIYRINYFPNLYQTAWWYKVDR
jgi:Arylsulfotransferase (ASST)